MKKKTLSVVLSILTTLILIVGAVVFFFCPNSAGDRALAGLNMFRHEEAGTLVAFAAAFTGAVATLCVIKKNKIGWLVVPVLALATFAAGFGLSFYLEVVKDIKDTMKQVNQDLLVGVILIYVLAGGLSIITGVFTMVSSFEKEPSISAEQVYTAYVVQRLKEKEAENTIELQDYVEPAKEDTVVDESSYTVMPQEAAVANLPYQVEEDKAHPERIPFAKKMKSQSRDLKDKYDELRDYILSYDSVKSRISVDGDTFRVKYVRLIQITCVGNKMKVYFALNPNEYITSTLPVYAAKAKKYKDIKAVMDVKSNLSVKRAKELVDAVMAAAGITKAE